MEVVAVRKLDSREDSLKLGDALGCSEIWSNHKPTGRFLPGVCAFDARKDTNSAFTLAKRWKADRVAGSSFPRFAALAGEVVDPCRGARVIEDGEVVVKNARVVAIYVFHTGRFHLI